MKLSSITTITNTNFFYFFIIISSLYLLFNSSLNLLVDNISIYGEPIKKNNNYASINFINNDSISNKSNIEKIDDFTLLIYMIGSDLEDKTFEASKDIDEMLKSHVNNSKVNIVLEIGGSKGKLDKNNNRIIDFSLVQRYQLEDSKLKNLTNSGIHKSMGEEETLSKFLNWGISTFPAKKYGLILWDHGGSYGGFGRDSNHNNDGLTLYELTNALHIPKTNNSFNSLSKNANFEFIGFDSCLMASLEVANSIYKGTHTDSRINAKFLIASEEIEPNWGWNYTYLLNILKNNPGISGRSLGEYIALSYANDSKKISNEKKFFADRDITLSVIDLKNIPNLIKKIKDFQKYVIRNIVDYESASKLLRTIDQTEHFGKTTTESFGIVDLHNLLTNIATEFPNLTSRVNIIKDTLKSVVVYNYKGESHPNSNGISFFFPITNHEYERVFKEGQQIGSQTELVFTKLTIDFSRLYKNDNEVPVILSQGNGSTITVKSKDNIKNIFYDIYFKNGDTPVVYTQQQPLSIINKSGSFIYKPQKILNLCNEKNSCVPVTMTIQSTKDLTKIFIPVLIKSKNGNERETNLLYAFQNNKFFFLGGIEDNAIIKGKGDNRGGDTLTIGREKISLQKDDIIYTRGLNPIPFSFLLTNLVSVNADQNIVTSDFNNRFNVFNMDFFLSVNDPGQIIPKFIEVNQSGIQFVVCDHSSLCSKSKMYNIDKQNGYRFTSNITSNTNSHVIVDKINDNDKNNSSYIYINYIDDYQLEYPSNWVSRTNDINNERFSHIFMSDLVTSSLFPIDGANNTAVFPSVELFIETEDSINSDSLRSKFNYFTGSESTFEYDNSVTIKNITHNPVNGYPSFQILANNNTNSLYLVGIDINNKIYLMYSYFENKYLNYLSIIKNIINTFKPNQFKNIDLYKSEYRLVDENNLYSNIEKIRKDYFLKDSKWKEYSIPKYNFSLLYLSLNNDTKVIEKGNPSSLHLDHIDTSIILPYTDFFSLKPAYVNIFSESSSKLDELKEIYKLPLNQNSEKFYLLQLEILNSANTNREVNQFYYDKFSNKNITGLVTESTYYSRPLLMTINEKSLSFFKDGDYIKIELFSPNDYNYNERIFDTMINSIVFR